MTLLVTFVVSVLVTAFVGYLVHRVLHLRWSGRLYKAHMDHHLVQYPPSNLMTPAYRKAAWYNSGTFLFTPPLVCLLAVIGGLAWWFGVGLGSLVVFALTMIGYALGNDWLHDTFHVKGHWLGRFEAWRNLREKHFVHHRNMKKNFGIVSFEWDRILKTYRDS